MDDLTLLTRAEQELSRVVATLGSDEMETVSNCPPWTVRRLASHALKNQLFWAGCVTGQDLMPQREAMAATPYDGDLTEVAEKVTARVVELWHTDGVMATVRDTPFGPQPGSVVVNFALIDAAAHGWDLAHSVGRPFEFPPDWIPRMESVVEVTCTEHAVEIGLVKPPTVPPVGATETQRLMAAAGRVV